jgi:hypothetical protein
MFFGGVRSNGFPDESGAPLAQADIATKAKREK